MSQPPSQIESKNKPADRPTKDRSNDASDSSISPDLPRRKTSQNEDNQEKDTGFRYLNSIDGHQHEIIVLKFSPCGQWLASGGEGKIVRIWKLSDCTLQKELFGNKSGVNDITWHEDVEMLATGGDDHSVKIWNFKLNDETHDEVFVKHKFSLKKHTGLVLCVAFKSCYIGNSYEHMLASGSHDSSVIIWDADKKTVRHRLTGHEEPVSAVDFNVNGSLLLSSSYDGSVRIWDTHNGEHLFTLVRKTVSVSFARFIKESDWYVQVVLLNGTIELWSFEKCIRRHLVTYKGHKNDLYPIFSGTCFGKYLMSGSEDGNICIWPISGGDPEKLILEEGRPIVAFDIHPHLPIIAYSQLSLLKDRDDKNQEYRRIDIWGNEKLLSKNRN